MVVVVVRYRYKNDNCRTLFCSQVAQIAATTGLGESDGIFKALQQLIHEVGKLL